MTEDEMVLLTWKIYKNTNINRGWFMTLLDSILKGESIFLETLKKAKRVFYIPEEMFK
jgi:hypothetical protein